AVGRDRHPGEPRPALLEVLRFLVDGFVAVADPHRGRDRALDRAAVGVLVVPDELVDLVRGRRQVFAEGAPGDFDLQFDARQLVGHGRPADRDVQRVGAGPAGDAVAAVVEGEAGAGDFDRLAEGLVLAVDDRPSHLAGIVRRRFAFGRGVARAFGT